MKVKIAISLEAEDTVTDLKTILDVYADLGYGLEDILIHSHNKTVAAVSEQWRQEFNTYHGNKED